jgi:amino acid adenylation domain-containing protein
MDERNYWLKRLEGMAAATTLDLGSHIISQRSPADETPWLHSDLDEPREWRTLEYRFESTPLAHLRRITGRSPFLLYTLLVSSLKVCLRRYTGTVKVAVGSPPLAECDHANALVIVDEVKYGESFRDLLQRVRQSLLDAYAHQRYPYSHLLKDLGLASGAMAEGEDAERSLLFNVAVALEGFHGGLAEAGEGLRLRFEEEPAEPGMDENAAGPNGTLRVRIEYDGRRYSHQLIARFIVHCEEILRMAVADTGRRVGELGMLKPEERQLLLEDWNRTGGPYPKDRRIHELISEQAAPCPERVALICDGRHVSYGEIDQRANQLGNYLQRLGVGPEIVVGVCLERSVELIVALLGILKAGGAYLPLDPESPVERLSYMMEDAGVSVALTVKELEARLPSFWGQTVCLDEAWGEISVERETEPQSGVVAENLVYAIYTSGSSGKPKGVAVHHQSLVARTVALVEAYGLTSADRLLQFVSPSFDAFAEEVFPSLSCGSSIVVDQDLVGYTTQNFFEMIDRLSITILHSTQTSWRHLVDGLSSNGGRVSSQLRLYISGGEAPSAETLKKWFELTPRQTGFVNAYGPTEATITSTVYRARTNSNGISPQARVPIGRPIANTQVYILDSDQEAAPVGVKGELYIGGAGVTRGYLGRPELTAERFIPDMFSGESGERLYRTGDVCRYLSDGEIEFVGRVDDQVKVRGYRIELREVEASLCEHPEVKQCVVMLREDNPGQQRLVAYVVSKDQLNPSPANGLAVAQQNKNESPPQSSTVVLKTELEVTAPSVMSAELRDYLQRRLPNYMVPGLFVTLNALPLMANGKVDRLALPSPVGVVRKYEAPTGETEIALAQIWAEVLNLDRVSRDDNFFELGGHSLLAVSLIERMRLDGLRADVRTVFVNPTLAELAAVVETEWRL